MNGFLLDTNCLSEIVRPKPDANVLRWMEETDEALLFLSALTLGEIRKGTASLPPGRRRSHLEGWFEIGLRQRFAGRILPVDEAVADRWGWLSAKHQGTAFPIIDGLLAATAIEHNLTIATRNVRDFANAHVPVFNPWT